MKKQFTELIGVCSALLFLLILTPNNASAQCEEGEQLHTLSVLVTGSFAGERAVELVDSEGDVTVLIECGDYPTAPAEEFVDYTFCATVGEEYTINFLDDWGDGWNFPFDFSGDAWILTAGGVPVGSGGEPDNGTGGDGGTGCSGFDEESSFTWTAEESDCTPPSFAFGSEDDCENFEYDLEITINGYGNVNGVATEFVGLELTSLDPDVYEVPELLESQTIDAFGNPTGTVYTALEDVPFGVTIQVEVLVTLDSPCNSIVEFTSDDECPPPNGECSQASAIECGGTSSGNIEFAAELPADLEGTSCGEPFATAVSTPGVWYSFTAPFNAIVTANTNGSDFDTKLFAFASDDCETFECVAGNDDGGDGLQSLVSFNLNEGDQVYFLINRLSTFTTPGDYEFEVTCEELLCTNPTVELSAVDGEGNPIDGCQDVTDEFFVDIVLSNSDEEDPNADYTVDVNGETFEAVAAGDEISAGPFTPGTLVNVDVTGNQDDLCGASAEYQSEVCPPDNNTPCAATVVECSESYAGTNIGADPAPEGEFCDFSSTSGIVYYSFTNDEPNNVFFRWNTCNEGTNFDTDSHLFDGPCEAPTCRPMSGQGAGGGYVDGQLNPETGFSQANCDEATSIFATGGEVILGPGETVLLGIDGFGTASGAFTLDIECESILCSSPSLTATAVAPGTTEEIADCQEFGDEYEVIVSLEGGEGNDDYTLVVGDETLETAVSGESYTFGPFAAGTTQEIEADGNTDSNCSASASAGTTLCPPTNDLCEDRIAVECGSLVGGTTLGATSDETGTCGTTNTGAPGVWYSLTVPAEANIDLDLCGSGYDTKIQVFEGACDDLVCVGGNDDQGADCDVSGLHSALNFTADADTEYLILVYGFGSNAGNYQMQVSCQDIACSPTADAVAVADAEGNPIEDCVPQTGEYYVSVALSGGSDQDYNVSVNNGDPVVAGFEGTAVVGPIPALQTANIAVEGVDNNLCTTTESVDATVCPPDNDDACNALFVPADGSQGVYSNEFATVQDGEPLPGAGTTAANTCQADDGWCSFQLSLLNTVWFETTVPPSGRMTVSTCGPDTDFDSQIAVYSGDCNELGGLELLGANDDQPGGCPDFFGASTLTLCAEPGSTVLIQIDAGDTFGGDIFNLSITEELDNEVCACEEPDIDPEFIIVSTFPICEGEGAPGFGLSFFAFENLGSSENLVYEYSYPGQPEPSPAIVEVPAGGEVTVDDVIPLGTTVDFTLTLSDPACEGVGLFPFSGAVAQPDEACDPDCEGVEGGGADPGTACETDEGLPGIYDADCNCQATPANDLPCNAEVLECGDVTTGSTVAASTSDDFCDFSSASGAVWYQYTATGNGTVTIETCLEGTDF
ncbi:MAG: hypothetical protein LC664_14055, partial [Flavobacteriales bacterium]|nr:hypothetical protein [Flavobacteriales bacterium]